MFRSGSATNFFLKARSVNMKSALWYKRQTLAEMSATADVGENC